MIPVKKGWGKHGVIICLLELDVGPPNLFRMISSYTKNPGMFQRNRQETII